MAVWSGGQVSGEEGLFTGSQACLRLHSLLFQPDPRQFPESQSLVCKPFLVAPISPSPLLHAPP